MSLRCGGGEQRKASRSGASNQVRVEDREGGGAPGPGPGGRRKRAGSCPEVGVCIWVCRAAVGEGAAHPGVLREGPTRGRVPQLDAARGQEGGRSPGSLRRGGRKWLSAPGAGCGGDRARRPQCRAAGLPCGARAQSKSSTYLRGWKWAGMGRNTVPEVKPPTPSPGAGDVGICFNVTSSLLKEFSQDHTIYKLNCKVKHTTTSSINTSVHFIDVRDHDDAERR